MQLLLLLFLLASAQAASPEPGAGMAVLSHSEIPQGGIAIITVTLPEGMPKKPPVGKFEGEEIPFYPTATPNEYEAVLAVQHDRKPGPGEVSIEASGRAGWRQTLGLKVTDANFGSESLKVSAKHVNPPKNTMKRILAEQKEVGKIYRIVTPKKYWDGAFKLPIESPMTSPYGTKRMYNGEQRNFHPGMDLKAAEGTPIKAPAGGKVVMAKDLYFTGNTVGIDHGYGVISIYAHMSKLEVKVGDEVEPGKLLGLSGKTGRVSGPHLHWQVVIHKVKVNPVELTQKMR